MLIVLIAKKDSDSGFGLTILEYSIIVYYFELPIPTPKHCKKNCFESIDYLINLILQLFKTIA